MGKRMDFAYNRTQEDSAEAQKSARNHHGENQIR